MMKKNLAMIMTATLLALSLSACGSSSEESIIETEEAADEANEEVESSGETQAAPAETTETAPAETTEAAPAEGTQDAAAAEGTDDTAAASNGPVELEGGTNQGDAVPIALGQQVLGTNEDNSWYSFTTSDTPDADYQITLINRTSSSGTIEATLLNMFGDEFGIVKGFQDGTASTLVPEDKLDVNTTYYIHITNFNAGTHDFSLIVRESTEE